MTLDELEAKWRAEALLERKTRRLGPDETMWRVVHYYRADTFELCADDLQAYRAALGEPSADLRADLMSALNQVFTVLRDLDCPLDIRVTMAQDIAQGALDAALSQRREQP